MSWITCVFTFGVFETSSKMIPLIRYISEQNEARAIGSLPAAGRCQGRELPSDEWPFAAAAYIQELECILERLDQYQAALRKEATE